MRRISLEEWERYSDWPMLALALGSIPLLVFENSLGRSAAYLNWAIPVVFAAELAARIVLHGPGRKWYALSRWYDFAIVTLTLIPPLMPFRVLRSARVLTAVRLILILALTDRALVTVKSIWDRTAGKNILASAMLLIVASSVAVWYFESEGGGDIDSFHETVWWSIVTMTTVGYGDIHPVTAGGQIIAIALMVSGITVFGLLTANLAAWFTQGRDDDAAEKIEELTAAVERLTSVVEEQRSDTQRSR